MGDASDQAVDRRQRPGDFPWDGASTYRNFTGGISGLHQESDREVYEQVIDVLVQIMEAVVDLVDAIAGDRETRGPGEKYCNIRLEPNAVTFESLFGAAA